MSEPLFRSLDSTAIAHHISRAQRSVCYAGPGIQRQPADAIAALAARIGPEMITVCIDFDERVMRMGYGDLNAVKTLRDASIIVRSTPGLRIGLVIVDDEGYIFTPTALYLEPDQRETDAPNALRLSRDQVAEAMARLSPAAKVIAMALAKTPEESERIRKQAVEVLNTTFDLIERQSALSSKPIEDEVNEIRKNFTPSIGKDHGRVLLKAKKPLLKKRLTELRAKLEKFQAEIKENLQKHLDASREEVVKYYLPRVIQNTPDAFAGQLLTDKPTEGDARRWLNLQLDAVFPKAEELIEKMELVETYKDVTFETLNKENFLPMIQKAFPAVSWEKAYTEFRAAGEKAS